MTLTLHVFTLACNFCFLSYSVFWVYDVFVYSNMLCDILCGKELLKINFPDTSKQNVRFKSQDVC